jgi:DNA-binding HxlR family transcriptional regulator
MYARLYILEQNRGALEIARLLDLEGTASKYEMRAQLLPRQRALDAALRNLVRLQLVEEENRHRFPFEKRYRLTGRGREFAVALRVWDRVLTD